MNNLIDSDF